MKSSNLPSQLELMPETEVGHQYVNVELKGKHFGAGHLTRQFFMGSVFENCLFDVKKIDNEPVR